MDTREQAFQKRLLSTFKAEAAEHVQALSSGLIELERGPPAEERARIVEAIFRRAHSLKGAARAVGLIEVESICQSAESVFAALKQREVDFSPALSDVLHEAVDALGRFLLNLDDERARREFPIADLVRRLDGAAKGAAVTSRLVAAGLQPTPPAQPPRAEPRTPPAEELSALTGTVRIQTTRLDALLSQTEELLSAKLAATQRAAELREVVSDLASLGRERASAASAANALNKSALQETEHESGDESAVHWRKLLEFTLWEDRFGRSLAAKLDAIAKATEQDRRSLDAMVDGLRKDVKKALMLPFSSLIEMLPKLARDLARDRGKDVELTLTGAAIEIDRRILQEMREPLIHIVRNAIDHGIEAPEVRRRAGKPERGTLSVRISHADASRIQIVVSDDGAGIDVEQVRAAARKAALAGGEDLDTREERDVLPLIFQSGVSTSPLVTDISGRGLGLAIVSERVERLGGSVAVETRVGGGTQFRIRLPVTLATFRGVHVRVDGRRFVVPTGRVERVLRVRSETIRTVGNRETIAPNARAVALVRLGDVLELPRGRDAARADSLHVLLLGTGTRAMAFAVDEILDEEEVLVKPLGKPLSRVRNISGAAILGSGEIVPILNVADLLRSAANLSVAIATSPQNAQAAIRKSILVAEDSITSRALLKNILEAAGYDVCAVVDGMEAFSRLKTQRYDLVVSDVEMPRMDGFELTAKIRSDEKLAPLPVVLVTGLDSPEHRERGAEAGASAYIVKSSFDHDNLLQTIGRLI